MLSPSVASFETIEQKIDAEHFLSTIYTSTWSMPVKSVELLCKAMLFGGKIQQIMPREGGMLAAVHVEHLKQNCR